MRSFLMGRYLSASRRAGGGERLLGGDLTGDRSREREGERSWGGDECRRGDMGDLVGDLSREGSRDASRGRGEISRGSRESREP